MCWCVVGECVWGGLSVWCVFVFVCVVGVCVYVCVCGVCSVCVWG